MNKGLFVTLEGGEGAGKSTLMHALAQVLKDQGYVVVTTREPGGTPLGEKIRQWLLSHDSDVSIGAQAELLLFLAARAQHIEELIAPALSRGEVVICDRFHDSTIAYQVAGRGLDGKATDQLCRLVCREYMPDLTLFLDVETEVGLNRARKRSAQVSDRIESEKIEFHIRVRQAFLSLVQQEPERIHRVDANREKSAVFKASLRILQDALKQR